MSVASTDDATPSKSSRREALALAALGGVAMALVGPPTNVIPGVWLGLMALYVAFERAPAPATTPRTRLRRIGRFFTGGARGFAFGLACNVLTFRFVPDVIVHFTPLPWALGALALFLLAAAQGLRGFATEHLHRVLARVGVSRPVAFGVATYLATFVPMIFPWTPAGGASLWPVTVQIADLIGERATTGLFAVFAAFVVEAVREVRAGKTPPLAARGPLFYAMFIAVFVIGHGVERGRTVAAARAAAPRAKVAALQPSIEARERWEKGRAVAILDKLTGLTKQAEAAGAELVVWPEAAYPYSLAAKGRRAPVGSYAPLQPGVRGPVLLGSIMHDGRDAAMNSAAVVHGDGSVSEPYHKMHLLWFGETVPLADVWPWLRKVFARGTGLTPGDAQVVLAAGPVRAAVLNCFEDTVPAAGREAALVEPNLLVNITNDAWFAGSQESALHLRVAVMRSIETRRDMVRSVNFGPTSWVAATGHIERVVDPPEPGFLLAEPALLTRTTHYSSFGESTAFVALGIVGVLTWRRRRRATSDDRWA